MSDANVWFARLVWHRIGTGFFAKVEQSPTFNGWIGILTKPDVKVAIQSEDKSYKQRYLVSRRHRYHPNID